MPRPLYRPTAWTSAGGGPTSWTFRSTRGLGCPRGSAPSWCARTRSPCCAARSSSGALWNTLALGTKRGYVEQGDDPVEVEVRHPGRGVRPPVPLAQPARAHAPVWGASGPGGAASSEAPGGLWRFPRSWRIVGLRRCGVLAQALGGRRLRCSGGVPSATGSRLRVAVAAAAAAAARATGAPLFDEAGEPSRTAAGSDTAGLGAAFSGFPSRSCWTLGPGGRRRDGRRTGVRS